MEIPIYKICHIRSPDDIAESAEGSANPSSLSPEYNVLYVFYGNVEFITDQGEIININEKFLQERENPFFQKIFSDYELNSIHQNDMKVVFLPERIYPDDSIETIKKKFLYLTRETVGLSYSELYFFCKQCKTITTQMAYDNITSNGKLEMTPVRVQNYLLNIDNQPTVSPNCKVAPDAPTTASEYAKLGPPGGGTSGNYTYSNIANLKLEEKPRIINVAMGQELNIASTYEYPCAVNPFDAMNADPFLEIHAGEIINTTNKVVLVDYDVFLHNTIYLVSAEDALVYAKEMSVDAVAAGSASAASPATKQIYESYIVQVYFPYLSVYRSDDAQRAGGEASEESDLSTIHSHKSLLLHKLKLFSSDTKILNERFLRQTANIKLLYDIYEKKTAEQNYIDDGIRGVEFMIYPETPYNQSLDTVFKMIHCSEYIPYIKYNPGKKRDNIYKLYISGVSRSGRKIPYLPKSDIFRLIKTTARKKSVAVYIQYTYSNPEIPNHKATHLSIPIRCEFYPEGSIYVKLFTRFSFTTAEIESIIKATVNPVLRVIKEHVEQSGFHMSLFHKLHHPQIELINLEYFAQIAITRNIDIKQMIRCISSVFNEIEGNLKKGIVLRYKRVSNYNEMSSQDAYVIEMMNTRQTDRDIIDGLRDNYMLSESDARIKLASILSSLQTQQFSRIRGGNIRIKNNPGFLTKITKGAFNNIITIEIANINNVLFLPALHIYLDSIIRIYQNPGSTEIPYDKIMELCANASAKAAAEVVLSSATRQESVVGLAPQLTDEGATSIFARNAQPEAVLDEIHPSDREESIEVMQEIVPVIKKTASSTSGTSAAAAAAQVVFGFEAESQKEEEIDLFDLLQGGDDDDEDDAGDSAPTSEQGGGGGKGSGGGAAAATVAVAVEKKRGPAAAAVAGSSDVEEDVSDITGMELANPNPFSKRIQERDPIIHLNEDVGKFNAYSRSCPWNVRRQPVILTSEEKARIDREHPNSYSHSITYGSDASKPYHYICPRYWSLKHNTSLTEEEVKSGKYGTIIPQKAKKIPPGANIFEFTDDKYHIDEKGNYKQHYPGFLKKDAHPKGLCVPCCFAQWDKPSQTARRQECQSKQFEAIRTETTTTSSSVPVPAEEGSGNLSEQSSAPPGGSADTATATPRAQPRQVVVSEPAKINEMKDDRILSSDKFPLEDNRWGYLPFQVQKFLFSDSRNCQVSIKNTAIKKDTPCLLRRGVETNDRQSFVSAIAYYFKESTGTVATTVVSRGEGAAVASKPYESIVATIESEQFVSPMGSKTTMKERISKKIAEGIQNRVDNLKRLNTEPGSRPGVETQAVAPAAANVARGGNVEEEYHSSEDETPVAMTPRSSGAAAAYSAAAAASTAGTVVSSYAVPNIREMRNIIIQSLDIDTFITLQNGTLSDVFYNPNKEIISADKYAKANISRTLPRESFMRICNAYENFIAYLDDDASVIDHTYLWDIVSRPNNKLFKNGNNIILIHIPDDDITNNVQVICPTNAYSGEVFDVNRKTIIIMKRDTYYEPIYLFESKSNGKFSVLGRFAVKSKTLMPKIRHVIENIRDLYLSYCRLNASQPREYKYKMNQPAIIIAKIVKDAGFEINAQVLNFTGKVIGLQIQQTITTTKVNPSSVIKKSSTRTRWSGFIPTAVSAPFVNNPSHPSPPTILMDDDTLWTMSYRETVDFLEMVAKHVKKITKKDIYCRPKVKVVEDEDGYVVGVLTETNQFIQVNVNKDPQTNEDDGIPAITENNHLVADKDIASNTDQPVDNTRVRYVRNIRLETNFYNVFRNTARNIMNRPENKAVKDDIEKLIASPFTVYENKLSQIIAHMKRIMAKYIAFIKYNKDTLKLVGEISGCITSDAETCGKKSYCLRESGGLCKLLLPRRNLMYPDIDNEIAYFGKLSDEMIRYERVKLFMFEPTKYLSFQDRKYDLRDDEIILLETFITQEYFENMEPADTNPYVFQTSFYTVAPSSAGNRGIQVYDPVYRKEYVDRYLELESSGAARRNSEEKPPAAASAQQLPPMPPGGASAESSMRENEVNHVLDFCHQVSKRKITDKMRQLFFPKMNTFEILFSNESNECSFDVILTILRIIAQNASKCPSGHSCIRQKPNPFASFQSSGPGEAAGQPAESAPESDLCAKCNSAIGREHYEFACRECNYFMCENCRHEHVDELGEMTISKIKNILVDEYEKLSDTGLEKKLTMILNGYGMKKYANLINEGRATLTQVIQSENYFLTNIDIWILALYFKIPIVFISQGLLSENGNSVMVLYGDELTESFFFVHPFTITQDVPSRFGLIEVKLADYSLLRIPQDFISPGLRDIIRESGDEGSVSIDEYIRTFKLGDIKHKKRVFSLVDKVIPEEGAVVEEASEGRADTAQGTSFLSLFQ